MDAPVPVGGFRASLAATSLLRLDQLLARGVPGHRTIGITLFQKGFYSEIGRGCARFVT